MEPKIGAEFTVTFDVDGHETTQTFTLCGWWEYDEAIVANHILVPESRVDAVLAEVGVTPPGQRWYPALCLPQAEHLMNKNDLFLRGRNLQNAKTCERIGFAVFL